MSQRDQPLAQPVGNRRRPSHLSLRPDLVVDVGEMPLDGSYAHDEIGGDGMVALALCHQLQHLELS